MLLPLNEKRKNYIRKLKNEDGNVVAGEEPKSFIANQYQQFFLSRVGNQCDELLDCVDHSITQDMNEILL